MVKLFVFFVLISCVNKKITSFALISAANAIKNIKIALKATLNKLSSQLIVSQV